MENTEQYQKDLEAVKKNGFMLKHIENQTEEICLEAVKKYGLAMQFVKNQTDKICLEAVKTNGWALQFVRNQTPEEIKNRWIEIIENNIKGK